MGYVIPWKKYVIHPTDALEPWKVYAKEFEYGSLAGCVGKELQPRKPGINEDGGAILVSENNLFAIMIDGHFDRDTTEILLEQFIKHVESIDAINSDEFASWVENYVSSSVKSLNDQRVLGEASFLLITMNLNTGVLNYFMVGDVMLFIHDPWRGWGKSFQISNRHYFEYINKNGVTGKHFGSIRINPNSQIMITTDGLIDEPVITMEKIDLLFSKINSGNKAANLVEYALNNNNEDDNITVIFIDTEKMKLK